MFEYTLVHYIFRVPGKVPWLINHRGQNWSRNIIIWSWWSGVQVNTVKQGLGAQKWINHFVKKNTKIVTSFGSWHKRLQAIVNI